MLKNTGTLTIGHQTRISTVTKQLRISNITQANRVDYYNVINKGKISVLNVENNVDSVYVAGITWILPYDIRPFEMVNVLNEGDIVTAAFKGNTTVSGSVTGQSFAHTTFSSDLNVRNLYVAGLVNINVGHIINSMNTGTITSTYSELLKGIHGTANTFVGGINTFNYNLIQDAANTGLIEYTNESTQSVSYFAATTNISTTNSSTFGGISITYTGGLVLGGIVGALGDKSATILVGHRNFGTDKFVAEVIDTSNDGDIYGKAKEYVRSGGILGIALSVELASGTYANTSSNVTPGTFTTAAIGSGDPIGQSLLSNGLNYGNVYAVTQSIGSYADQNGIVQTGNNIDDNRYANSLRPGINASAGGVVGYGLTRMVRMLNHGVISSTDVAGGIIGSTYILGGVNQSSTPITTVEINTAVHYGKVRAIKTGYFNSSRVYVYENNRYNSFNYNENENFENGNRYYLLNEYDNFIHYRATSSSLIETFQQGRRGFGGVFGRLQRGNYGTMRSTEFKNVMNMDKEIDMIGRVDSNQHGSLVYYRFFTGEETYFTAKEKDTTPNAFAGFKFNDTLTYNFQNANIEFTVRRVASSNYIVENLRIISGSVTKNESFTKKVMRPTSTSTSNQAMSYSKTLNPGYILQK